MHGVYLKEKKNGNIIENFFESAPLFSGQASNIYM